VGHRDRHRRSRYTERDYADIADACHAIAQILRQHGGRPTGLDQDACELCEEPLDMLACSQCGVDAFVRTCEHGGPRPIRVVEGALYCLTCRPYGLEGSGIKQGGGAAALMRTARLCGPVAGPPRSFATPAGVRAVVARCRSA
jgi:hypothetical protein